MCNLKEFNRILKNLIILFTKKKDRSNIIRIESARGSNKDGRDVF